MPARESAFALGRARSAFTLESNDLPSRCGNRDTGVAVRADAHSLVEPLIHELGLAAADWTDRAGGKLLPFGRQGRHYEQIYRTADTDSSAAVARSASVVMV